MAVPTIKVQVAFASNPYADAPSWTDISADFLSLYTNRGRQHFLNRIETGTATIMLDNRDGDYWPDNSGGTYYPNVLPKKLINLQATYDGTPYDLYTGFVEEWRPDWLKSPAQVGITRVQCVDLLKHLSRLEVTDGGGYAEEASGTRVGNVLDDLGWPAGARDLDTGQSTMIASGALVEENAMGHLQKLQESELGIVYQSPDGDIQFEDRHHRLKSPHTVSQATFGDDGGEMPYQGLSPFYDDHYIFNDIAITRDGGSRQAASDATSITAYGKCSFSRDNLLMKTDVEALSMAEYIRSRFKDPVLRARTLEIMPARDAANLYPKVLAYDLSTRITLRLNEASLDRDYYIEGISHQFAAKSGVWVTKWELSPADNQTYWALGVAGFSEIGETTRLAF